MGLVYYHDVYVGFDDGKARTGHIVAFEGSVGPASIGDTFDHNYINGEEHNFCRNCGLDISAKSIMECSNSKKDSSSSVEILGISIGDGDDLVLGLSGSFHVGLGGHVSVGFNLTEYVERSVNSVIELGAALVQVFSN